MNYRESYRDILERYFYMKDAKLLLKIWKKYNDKVYSLEKEKVTIKDIQS